MQGSVSNVRIAGRVLGLGTADTIVHHVHAFTIHVTALILLKGLLFARGSRLVPDKARLGFRFPCDGPGRGLPLHSAGAAKGIYLAGLPCLDLQLTGLTVTVSWFHSWAWPASTRRMLTFLPSPL